MAIEKVRAYFQGFGLGERIMEFDVSSATVELAARAVGCEPCRIAKTLSFMLHGAPILLVASGDTKIDNVRYKARFGVRPRMLSPDDAERLIGHAVGGVCPFAVNAGVEVYLDLSLKRFATVFTACGSSNSVIELTPDDLQIHSHSRDWVDVCRLV